MDGKDMAKLTQEQSKLVEENHNLIYGFLHKYNLEYEEWYDLCAIGLINAAMTYKVTNKDNANFSTYAYKCMFTCMSNELRNKDRLCRRYNDLISLDYEYDNNKGDIYNLHELISNNYLVDEEVIDKIYSDTIIQFIFDNLIQENHKEAIRLLINGESVKCAASSIGISRQALELKIKKIYKKYTAKFKPVVFEKQYRKRK